MTVKKNKSNKSLQPVTKEVDIDAQDLENELYFYSAEEDKELLRSIQQTCSFTEFNNQGDYFYDR